MEVHNSTKSLREDLRRTDDRAQKQVDDLRTTHANEVERLMDLIKTLLIKDTGAASHTPPKPVEQPRMTPAQLAYANAAPASSFFGAPAAVPNDLTAHAQYMAYYMQQLQEQQVSRIVCGVCIFVLRSQQPAAMMPVATGLPSVPKPPTVAPPVAAVPPVAVTASVPLSVPASAVSSSAPPVTTSPASASATTTTATTTASSLAGLFQAPKTGTATATVQPGKVEPPKTESTPPKPAFSFITPKPATPATPPVASDASKPAATIFSGVKPTENIFSKTPESKTSVKKESGDGHDEEEHVDEFEPQVDFKPVCPLPELVKVVTGEEDEKVLFEERCKLYRYSDETKEWKERGTGTMKVLENTTTNKCRIVMRREQVHKVCANHQLLPGMTIQVMPRQEKAMMWYCEDFSEEQKSHEKLSARFASVEVANKFKEVFENAVKKAGHGTPMKPISTAEAKKEVDKPKTVEKDDKSKKDEAKIVEEKGDVKKEESVAPQKGYGDQFKLQPGQSVLPASTIPLGGTSGGATQQKFTFGLSAAAAAKDSQTSASNTPKSSLFGSSSSTPTTGFTFGSKPSIFGGATAKTTEGSPLPTFSFAKKPDATSTATSTTTTTAAPSPVTFSFKQAGSTTSSPSTGSSIFGGSKLFGASKPVEEKKDADKTTEQPKTEQKLAVTDKKEQSKGESGKSKGDNEDGEADHGADEEYEPDVQFQPVIPLPDLVDVVTGEEEEQVVFTARAKLFRFIKETKENKERGVGDIKILRNPKTNAHRVVMRREQVHKVCANFAILPSIELNEKKGMPNVYNWICRDYSESAEGSDEIFTAKFKTPEIAKEFHDKFVAAAAAHPVSDLFCS
ncbi:RanBP1 domain protein [Ancylostoma ceylanicum]|uniref:RanBP1 domain protein n=1 Tax=Ancylostoma ceylanicum TaxID=53326 RepID=A0A0D6LZ15_9BILA|nr:RanBP1 domain protein [Ancylostoma ceylanicum]